MTVAPLRWIVVGAGSIGRRHLRNLRALGYEELVAVRRGAAPLLGDLERVPVRGSLDEARGSGPAIALICTPTALHLADATAAAALGCHVLIEKPLGSALEGLAGLRAELARHDARAGVAHSLRFHPVIALLRERLAAGAIGRPLHTEVWCGQHLADWRPGTDYRESYSAKRELGGGVVLDLVHELDYLRVLLGEAEAVLARLGRSGALDIETEDSADLIIDFGAGRIAACHLDYLSRPPARGGVIVGERGTLRWDLLRPAVEEWSAPREAWRVLPLPEPWERNDMYRDELRAFAAHVLEGGTWESDVESGARSLAIALAAHRSSETRAVAGTTL